MANDALRYSLVQKLKDEHCLWSFNDVSASDIPDDVPTSRQWLPDTLTSWQDERIGATYWGYL